MAVERRSHARGRIQSGAGIQRVEEAALLGELLDRDPAVAQDSPVTVDERDGAATGAGVREARVQRDQADRAPQLANVDPAFALGPLDDGEFDGLVAYAKFSRVAHV